MLLKLATCARDAFDTALSAMVSSPLRKNNNYFMDLAMLDARKRQDHGTRASALGEPTAISKKLDWTPSLHRLLDDWMIPLPVKRATCCWNRSSRVKLTSRQTLNLSLNPELETRDKMKHGGVRLKRRDLESITNTWQSHTNLHTAPLQVDKRIRNVKVACTKTHEREKRKRVLKVKDWEECSERDSTPYR